MLDTPTHHPEVANVAYTRLRVLTATLRGGSNVLMHGLHDTMDVLTKAGTDDGYGSVTSEVSVLVAAVPCRRTRMSMSGAEAATLIGQGNRRLWRFSSEPVLTLVEKAGDDETAYMIRHNDLLYDILYWEHRAVANGTIDHTEFRAEQR